MQKILGSISIPCNWHDQCCSSVLWLEDTRTNIYRNILSNVALRARCCGLFYPSSVFAIIFPAIVESSFLTINWLEKVKHSFRNMKDQSSSHLEDNLQFISLAINDRIRFPFMHPLRIQVRVQASVTHKYCSWTWNGVSKLQATIRWRYRRRKCGLESLAVFITLSFLLFSCHRRTVVILARALYVCELI